MKKTRFSEEPIIRFCASVRIKTADVCRKHGISSGTLYGCRRSTAAWTCRGRASCKVLGEENGRLKRLLADAIFHSAVLGEGTAKNW